MNNLEKFANYAEKCYVDANSLYDEQPYIVHINMVVTRAIKYKSVFKHQIDADTVVLGSWGHDLIEDAKQTYNNIKKVGGHRVADVVLAVTDVPAENRLMRHLLTMPKTVKDYRAIILKMCDMGANAEYSLSSGSSMFEKYKQEYAYRRPIFKQALKWYEGHLNKDILDEMWKELDEIHFFN